VTLETTPPERDPDLSDIWAEMRPSERLAYLVHDGEPEPPAGSETARQMYRDLHDEPDLERNNS
jgi:hypothetical protein